jgi:predicted secreted protein
MTMAKRLGKDYRLFVGDGASPEVFAELAGQRGLSFNATPNFFDTSSKDDYPFATQGAGRQTLNITVDGVLDLPDTTGIEALNTAQIAGTAKTCQIVYEGVSPSVVTFQGSMFIQIAFDYGDEAPATYTVTLSPAAAPTVNDLTP